MNAINIFFLIVGAAAAGSLFGVMVGLNDGKKRNWIFLAFMVNKMEILRSESRIKATRRDEAAKHGDSQLADLLTKELESEGVIFYEVQHAISDWCINHNEKDPFAS